MKTTDLVINNCRIFSAGEPAPADAAGWVSVEGGRIQAVGCGAAPEESARKVFDGQGGILCPGFIDIHTHGANGFDFCAGETNALRGMARAKLREGVTTFLPTTLTAPETDIAKAIQAGVTYMENPDFARAPALHIEGPFINPECAGAQNPAYVRDPDWEELRRYADLAPLGIVSLAIEMPGAMAVIRKMRAANIAASAAHTAASFAQLNQARENGLMHLTHFCNQMTGLHHREIGLVGGGLSRNDLQLELICDTIHLCPDMLNLILSVKDIRQLMMITDSVAASWLPDGEFELGGLAVVVKDGAARLKSGALAGSTLRFCDGLRHLVRVTGLPLEQLLFVTGANQARSLGWNDLGAVKPGYRADLVLLDDDFEPTAVWVGGRERFADACDENIA